MVAIRGHFDGKVIVPDEPVDLPRNQQLLVHVQPLSGNAAKGVSGRSLLPFAGTIPADDLRVMAETIEEGCERIRPDEW